MPSTTPPDDPVSAFIEAACPLRDSHAAGGIEEAEAIRARHPDIAARGLYAAAQLGDETAVRQHLSADPASATAKGGPRGWDALTYLCFSRYLRIDRARAAAFLRTARALLDAGANADTGWIEMIDHPNPRPILESAIYGAAGIARDPDLTRLLLERGADPNDEETAYHAAETYDNTVVEILLNSGKLNERAKGVLLIRKCDWHDLAGLRLVLEHGGDPNWREIWGLTALNQVMRRDNRLAMIEALLDFGADPTLPNREGRTAIQIAARRGRADALDRLQKRGAPIDLAGLDALLASCARDDAAAISALTAAEPGLKAAFIAEGGTALAEFSGNGNLAGVRRLLALGVSVDAPYRKGDAYFGVAPMSTALQVAAWRDEPEVVRELVARGAAVEATDAEGRTALQLAVKACVDSAWADSCSPDCVRALVEAGASADGIELPTGHAEIDRLLSPRFSP